MSVPFNRRTLLKLAAALPVSLPLYSLAGSKAGIELAYHLVKNQVTGQGVKAGAVALVDTAVTQFSGRGYYLYPDWGRPVVYEVKRHGDSLSFHYPGLEKPLWQIAADAEPVMFSGRVEGIVDPETLTSAALAANFAGMRALAVPSYPSHLSHPTHPGA